MQNTENTESSMLSNKYQQKTDKEHILSNPDTYIGSVEQIDSDVWIFDSCDLGQGCGWGDGAVAAGEKRFCGCDWSAGADGKSAAGGHVSLVSYQFFRFGRGELRPGKGLGQDCKIAPRPAGGTLWGSCN